MTFLGMVACQIGTAFAARTDRVSLRSIGVFSNPALLGGIAFELALTAALIYLPLFHSLIGTASLPIQTCCSSRPSRSSSGVPTRSAAGSFAGARGSRRCRSGDRTLRAWCDRPNPHLRPVEEQSKERSS